MLRPFDLQVDVAIFFQLFREYWLILSGVKV